MKRKLNKLSIWLKNHLIEDIIELSEGLIESGSIKNGSNAFVIS